MFEKVHCDNVALFSMPTETSCRELSCQTLPSSSQHNTCTTRAKKTNHCQLLPDFSQVGYECSCPTLRGPAAMWTRGCLRRYSWFSFGKIFPDFFTRSHANCSKFHRLGHRANEKNFMRKRDFFSQNNLLVFLYVFITLFFITITDAAPHPRSESLLVRPASSSVQANRTKLAKVHADQLTPLSYQESNSDPLLEPLFDQPSPKVRRASEVRRRERKYRNGKKQRKNKRKNKEERKKNHKKTSKDALTPQEIIRKHYTDPYKMPFDASPRRQRLYNKNGVSFHLAVWRNGSVSGEKSDKRSRYSLLEIRGISEGGIVSIMGVQARKYICVSRKGAVKAKKRFNSKRCQFKEEILPNHQNTYESLSCSGCFLNLRKNGRVRRLKKTNPRLTQAHFLPRLIARSRSKRLQQAKQGETVTITFSADDIEGKNTTLPLNQDLKKRENLVESNSVPDKNVLPKSKENANTESKHLEKLKRRRNRKKTKKTIKSREIKENQK